MSAFKEWLCEWLGSASLPELERCDWTALLRESGGFDVPPAERLRLLAIELEDLSPAEPPRRRSAALDRIHRAALQLAPDDSWIHSSRGISAATAVEEADSELPDLCDVAEAELRIARELDPDDPAFPYALGYALYMNRADALALALSLEPDHAHILETVRAVEQRPGARSNCSSAWGEAADAYSRVPRQAFAGPPSWRMDLLVEQRGWCGLKAGDTAGAREDPERILARYEKQPHLAKYSVHLRDATDEAFPDLPARVLALEADPPVPAGAPG